MLRFGSVGPFAQTSVRHLVCFVLLHCFDGIIFLVILMCVVGLLGEGGGLSFSFFSMLCYSWFAFLECFFLVVPFFVFCFFFFYLIFSLLVCFLFFVLFF